MELAGCGYQGCMVDALVGTDIGRAALRELELQKRVLAGIRVSEEDAELASRRAAGAHARARRAAEKAALTLAESARLHERVANLQQRDDDKAAKAAAERDRRDAAQKRREAAAEWWRQPFTADS